MNTITIRCPKCNQKNNVAAHKKDQAKCARCGYLFATTTNNNLVKQDSGKLVNFKEIECNVCFEMNRVDTSRKGAICRNCKNSLSTVSNQRENSQVRRFSPKPGAPPRETREIEFHRVLNGICSITENPFKIIFGKEKSDKYYHLVKTKLIADYQDDGLVDDVRFKSSKQDKQTFKREEFLWTYSCPDCGDTQSYIHCTGCYNYICGSTRYIDDDGAECGSCPVCEGDFELVPPYSDPVGTTVRVKNKVIGEVMEEPQLPPISNPIFVWDDEDKPEVKVLPNPQKKELNSSNVQKALPPSKKK